jgi:plastocyanin
MRARALRARSALLAAVGLGALASVAAAATLQGARSGPPHRLHFPTPPLPHSLSVDESEWSVRPSETVLASGKVTISVYNRGMDTHNLTVQGPNGLKGRIRAVVTVASGSSATLTGRLPPGTYVFYCSLFMGTPMSHYAKGMHATVIVR